MSGREAALFRALVSLWWTQKRRLFSWRNVFVTAYFGLLFLLVGAIVYIEAGDKWGQMAGGEELGGLPIAVAALLLVGDLFLKYFFMNDAVLMDAFLKTKPVGQACWNCFIVFASFANGMNAFVPALTGLLAFLMMPFPLALLAVLMAYTMAAMNSMLVACIRKAEGFVLKAPLLLALLFYILFAILYGMNLLGWPVAVLLAVFTALNLVAVYTLYLYFANLVRYDEHQSRTSRVRRLSGVSFFSMEYVAVLRSKRLRTMVCFLPLCVLPQVYMMSYQEMDYMTFVTPLLPIYMASGVLGQWTMGVEANYFRGLWTKPVSIETLLRNKFRFYALLSLLASLLVVPSIWVVGRSPLVILSCLLYAAGFGNLLLMPSCLFSTRLDLFSSAFFNYQGAGKGIHAYGLVISVPFAIAGLAAWLLPVSGACLLLGGMGLLGLLLHRWAIRHLARAFVRRRHERMEAYLSA